MFYLPTDLLQCGKLEDCLLEPCFTPWTSTQQACQKNASLSNLLIANIIRVLDLWVSSVFILMGTSPPFIEPPASPLSAGYSGVNSTGQRSQDHRLHSASDCWLLMLKWVLRGGVDLCVFRLYLLDCAYIYRCVCDRVWVRAWISYFSCHASWHVYMRAHAYWHVVCRRWNLIGQTTVAEEPWWSAGSLSSCWWGFGGLSLRGGIQFPPPARLCCLDSLAQDWREVVWHSRLPSHWESLEKVLSDLWRTMTPHRKNVAQQKAVRASVSQDLRLSLTTVLFTTVFGPELQCTSCASTASPTANTAFQVNRAWSAPALKSLNEDVRLFPAFPEVVRVGIVTPLWIVRHSEPLFSCWESESQRENIRQIFSMEARVAV